MDVEVIKCRIQTKEDLKSLKEFFRLQVEYPTDIFILDYSKPSNMLLPDFEYIIYINCAKYPIIIDTYTSNIKSSFLKKYRDDLYYDVNIDPNDPRRVYKFEPYTII